MRFIMLLAIVALSVMPAGAGRAGGLTIARQDCERLAVHAPAPDASYTPGVDVHGRPVAPADLPASTVEMPRAFTIDIDVLLAERLGLPRDSRLFRGEANIGVVEVRKDQIFFNGQPLNDSEARAIAVICGELVKKR